MVRNVSTVLRIKNSRTIYIPMNIIKELNIQPGDIYKFSIDGKKIIMSLLTESPSTGAEPQ